MTIARLLSGEQKPYLGGRPVLVVGLAVLLFTLAIVPKVVYLVATQPDLSPDERHFVALSRTVRGAGTLGVEAGQPEAIRPPLYPLVLALFPSSSSESPKGALLFQVVTAALAVVLVAWLAFRLGGTSSAIVAGLLAVSYVPMMKFPSRYLTETLAVALLMISVWIVDRVLENDRSLDLLMAGTALALAALTRVAMVPLVAVVLLVVLMRRGSWRRRFSRMVLLTGAFLMAYSPWVLRNCVSVGRCVLTTDQGSSAESTAYFTAELIEEGYTLAEARRVVLYDRGLAPDWLAERASDRKLLPMPEQVPITVRLRHIGQRLAILLGAHPSLELPFPFAGQRAAEVRVLRWFNYGWTVFLFVGVVLCAGVAGRDGSLRLLSALALPAGLVAVHAVVHAIPRYQCLPYFAWTVAAGVGWSVAAGKIASLAGARRGAFARTGVDSPAAGPTARR